MKKILLVFVSVLVSISTDAQDKIEATLQADVVSNYIWRGEKLDDAAIQPTLGISYKGLSLSAWGSYGLNSSKEITKEFDLTLAYSIKGFNLGITDYFCVADDDISYFYYPAHETAHIFEAFVGYDFGPVSLQGFMTLAGADYCKANGKRSYSSYLEANAPFKLGGLDWNATVGAVPYKANESSYAAYSNAKGFAVTNLALKASKDIKITDSFTLPAFAQIVTNPSLQKAYFVFGITLQPFQ